MIWAKQSERLGPNDSPSHYVHHCHQLALQHANSEPANQVTLVSGLGLNSFFGSFVFQTEERVLLVEVASYSLAS